MGKKCKALIVLNFQTNVKCKQNYYSELNTACSSEINKKPMILSYLQSWEAVGIGVYQQRPDPTGHNSPATR